MTRYRCIPFEVEAFRLTDANRDNSGAWPSWARAAYAKVWNEPGAISDMLGSRNLYVRDQRGLAMHVAELDDWIVRESDGNLIVVKPEAFAELFEPVLEEVA